MMLFWTLAGALAALHCVARGVQDLRQKRYIWGALGIVSGAILLLTPIGAQTHTIKIDLPAST